MLNVHKGNVLANLTDFQNLTYEAIEKKTRKKLRYRDHGHEANIIHSMTVSEGKEDGEAASYVEATALFFLSIRQAIDGGKKVILA